MRQVWQVFPKRNVVECTYGKTSIKKVPSMWFRIRKETKCRYPPDWSTWSKSKGIGTARSLESKDRNGGMSRIYEERYKAKVENKGIDATRTVEPNEWLTQYLSQSTKCVPINVL